MQDNHTEKVFIQGSRSEDRFEIGKYAVISDEPVMSEDQGKQRQGIPVSQEPELRLDMSDIYTMQSFKYAVYKMDYGSKKHNTVRMVPIQTWSFATICNIEESKLGILDFYACKADWDKMSVFGKIV